ncbi:hypothetical protein NDU88_001559 [Pleurodeles waltl]|uniref:Uncharacterized protein n=1 Tax=Pleurodeles waltl TaxID=8319 RepID=A0AAV7SZP0_PLEWA|nr:hypothetical protein NDU88_001559 [Pleurodeles waltl]
MSGGYHAGTRPAATPSTSSGVGILTASAATSRKARASQSRHSSSFSLFGFFTASRPPSCVPSVLMASPAFPVSVSSEGGRRPILSIGTSHAHSGALAAAPSVSGSSWAGPHLFLYAAVIFGS